MADNPSIRTYVSKIESTITFRTETGIISKLLGSTKSKISKDESGQNVPRLEITEVVLFHCNFISNYY